MVYMARDQHLDRLVALKVLPTDKMSDPERRRRFVQEAKAASALNHPNIVTIYDIGSEGGTSYIAMERVEGATLRELLAGGAGALSGGAGRALHHRSAHQRQRRDLFRLAAC